MYIYASCHCVCVCLGKGGNWRWWAFVSCWFPFVTLHSIVLLLFVALLLLEMEEEISMSGYAWLRLSYGRRLVVVSGPLAEAQASKRPGWHLVGTKGGCNRSALNKGTAVTCFLPTLAGCCGLQWQPFLVLTCHMHIRSIAVSCTPVYLLCSGH